MGKKAAGKPKAKAGSKPPAKRQRIAGPPPTFDAALGRPPLHDSAGAGAALRFLIVDVGEGHGGPNEAGILLHGLTAAGHSVTALVSDFRPYFYCKPLPDMGPNDEEAFCDALSSRLPKASDASGAAPDASGAGGAGDAGARAVSSVTRVRLRSLMYYQRDEADFLRVELASHRLLTAASREVERGFAVQRGGGSTAYGSPVWEASVPFVLRFLVDTGLVGGGWVEFGAGSYTAVEAGARQSASQIEIRAPASAAKPLAAEGEFLALAPFRLLALDARADNSGCVASVAAVLVQHGAAEPLARVAWVRSGHGEPIEGSSLHCFADEADLCEHFQAFLKHCDPDLIIGYELPDRILSLLLGRAQASGAGPEALHLGRLVGVESKVKNGVHPGTQEARKEINAEGRLLFDVARLVSQEHRLTSYALPSVARHFLGQTHFELQTADVAELLSTRPDHLARHVLRDAEVTWRLFDRLCFVYNFFEMARVTGVPIDYLLTRGQMIKVTSQLLRKARANGFVLPARGAAGGDTFEGGYVMEPLTGLYEEPIVVLDFASLYPSIMMAHNLCYTTLLAEGADRALGLEPNSVLQSPASTESGVPHKFVTREVRRGILPQILEELLSARKAAKNAMKATNDPVMRSVLNGRQLALKISANSVYGFTGATSGNMPCLEIASTVTGYGREMISQTAKFIESECTQTRVIYGDTDSVMLSFGDVPREDAARRGREVAQLASARFVAPIRLEFEKVFQPYLLLNKKRYAGLPWDGDRRLQLDMKGIETVRRDWCGLVRQVVERSLELLLKPDRSVDAAVEYVRGVIADLRRGTVNLGLLVISKTLGKKGEADYVAKVAHVELAEKLRKRDPASAPRPGERVPYVVVAGAAGAKVYERAENPQYAHANGLPVDADYYIEQQLRQPLLRIFEPIVGGDPGKVASMLFAGGEGRRAAAPSVASKGGLGSFFKRGEKCIACNAAVAGTNAFCKACEGTEKATAARDAKAVEGRALRDRQCALRTTCSNCVGLALGDAHERCANVDCEIFFERSQVARGITEAQAAFARLNLEW